MTTQRKLIGKYLSWEFVGRKDNITGVLLDYNDEWTIIRRCADYTLDGYTIFRNERVEYIIGDFEKRASKILKLKGYLTVKEPKVPLTSLKSILDFVSRNYSLIQLDTKTGDAFDVVKYLGQTGMIYNFHELLTDGKWRDKLEFPAKVCKYISFDNDYLNSLALITKFK